MGKKKDLTGLKFNYLTVISVRDERSPSNKRKWLCRCDCGTEKIIIGGSIVSGNTISCGCKCHVIDDLVGKRFGKLVVVEMDTEKRNGVEIKWICKCDCGVIDSFTGADLKRGDTTSCGCYNAAKNITHGMRSSREYATWVAMKDRCLNPKSDNYPYWGGRGIKIYEPWVKSFEAFYAYVGPRPTPQHSLDRWPNNETGHYEPGNVRWGTDEQQSRNMRSNRWLEHNGERMIITDWAKRFNTKHQAIRYWLDTGKSFEEIVEYFTSRNA